MGGKYNFVWKSNFNTPTSLVDEEPHQGPWVLKYAIPSANSIISAMSNKFRAMRLWNEINADLPKAGLYQQGWVAPYIENTRPATDEERAEKLIDIYINTRRIILDATNLDNILTKIDTRKVILVDVDVALKRRGSVDSLEFFNHIKPQYWIDMKRDQAMPKTFEIIENLFYLEDCISEDEIEALSQEGKITVEAVLAITPFRVIKRPVSFDFFSPGASQAAPKKLNVSSPLSNTKQSMFYHQDDLSSAIDPPIPSPQTK